MSIPITATAKLDGDTSKLPFSGALKPFLARRTRIGFRIGEALFWVAFDLMWPVVLGIIYFFGGMFESGGIVSLEKFVLINFFVTSTKIFLMIPFWWLFFVLLKDVTLFKKVLLHIVMSFVYALLIISCIYYIRTTIFNDPYPKDFLLSDLYNVLFFYSFHFILFHAYNLWLSAQRQRLNEQALREAAFQSEISVLKAQIEPHFLFNTLNSISASVPPSLERTRILIAQLADTFRYALRVSERQVVPLCEEIGFIKTWLALEKNRFGQRLHIDYCIDPRVLEVMVPPMILQPIVENALKHGIGPLINGGTVTIICQKEDNFVHIAVSDTGVGYQGELQELLTKGVGLGNSVKRLRLLYGESMHVSRNQQGLRFSFKVPLEMFHEKKGPDHR